MLKIIIPRISNERQFAKLGKPLRLDVNNHSFFRISNGGQFVKFLKPLRLDVNKDIDQSKVFKRDRRMFRIFLNPSLRCELLFLFRLTDGGGSEFPNF